MRHEVRFVRQSSADQCVCVCVCNSVFTARPSVCKFALSVQRSLGGNPRDTTAAIDASQLQPVSNPMRRRTKFQVLIHAHSGKDDISNHRINRDLSARLRAENPMKRVSRHARRLVGPPRGRRR